MLWLLVGGGVVVAIAAAAFAGSRLPAGHVASGAIDLSVPPEAVWETISDFAHQGWRSDLRGAARLPDDAGRPVWQETLQRGMRLQLRTDEAEAPRRLVRTVVGESSFTGCWTYEIEALPEGCRLTVTERGEIHNPIFRLLGRSFDMSATIRKYLSDLERHLAA